MKDRHHFSEPNQSEDNCKSIFSSKGGGEGGGVNIFWGVFHLMICSRCGTRQMGITSLTGYCVTTGFKPAQQNQRELTRSKVVVTHPPSATTDDMQLCSSRWCYGLAEEAEDLLCITDRLLDSGFPALEESGQIVGFSPDQLARGGYACAHMCFWVYACICVWIIQNKLS